MYPEPMIIPMREDLTRIGVQELKTAADVDRELGAMRPDEIARRSRVRPDQSARRTDDQQERVIEHVLHDARCVNTFTKRILTGSCIID